MALRSAFLRNHLTRSWRACVAGASKSPTSALINYHNHHALAAISSSLCVRQASFWSRNKSQHESAASVERAGSIDPIRDAQTSTDTLTQSIDPTTSQIISQNTADFLQTFHETVSFGVLPWTATISAVAVALRLICFPVVYYNQIHTGRLMLASKELPRIQYFVRNTPGSLFEKYMTFRRLRNLALQSAGTSRLKVFPWHVMVYLPSVIATTMGMREITRRTADEWRTAGFGWITDLTASDPMGILPVVTTGLWLWILNPKSTPRPSAQGKSADGKGQVLLERIMAGSGESMARIFQVLAVVSLSVTTELPAGILLFWISNGVITGAQRYALSNDSIRRRLGLLTSEDLREMEGPPVLQSTEVAVEKIREELSYVQREVLSCFKERRVDEKLCKDVNKMLNRERWSGRISVGLKAIVREDDRDGKKYVAIVRSV